MIFTSGTGIEPKVLGSLGCYRYKLKEPLEYQIEDAETGEVIAVIKAPIAEYGYGSTESEAVDDLRSSLIDYFHSLQAHKFQLGKNPKRDLRWLEKNIEVQWIDY